ncbi:DUF3944 domain-containing protein [Avibacterium sp. 21-586]|uniref:DUF3944 domain-containing protein n=1 Tax=Avibacterium sp. 21-586 TaxID=2911534 RepID=UPI002245A6F0|nr:DUF3944 domain-containing protein [Avibacterium sp. 21-586]MCW9711257.1 DUF3944 domain-containing protein [Avibacterium sp. 21-586]
MAYRHDPDLEFLANCSSDELDQLVYLLTHDKDGNSRLTEELTSSDDYKRYYPEHSKYWQNIAAEIQLFGGNTLVNLFRGGRGVPYKEVLCDVCDKMKVNYNKYSSVQQIEENLLMKILKEALEKMTPEEREKLANELGVPAVLTSQGLTATFLAIFKAGGFKSYQLTVIIVNAVLKTLIGRGLTATANATLTRVASILAGPIGWVITGLWTAVDIAGPAYRITIPAVIEISYLRKLSENREAIEAANQVNL